jgi:hypothetical protein
MASKREFRRKLKDLLKREKELRREVIELKKQYLEEDKRLTEALKELKQRWANKKLIHKKIDDLEKSVMNKKRKWLDVLNVLEEVSEAESAIRAELSR